MKSKEMLIVAIFFSATSLGFSAVTLYQACQVRYELDRFIGDMLMMDVEAKNG